MVLDRGAIRWIKIGDEEVVRGIELAVRDPAWATVAPEFSSYQVDQRRDRFAVRLVGSHSAGDIDLAWVTTIEGHSDGSVRVVLEGMARRSFHRARIGLCVLHPKRFAGRPIRVTTPWGIVRARLPREVAPVSPVSMVRSMHMRLDSGATADLTFEGDLFEMEDQRNFGDASFKTYSTPLCIPYPVWVEAGTRITQSVALSVAGVSRPGRPRTRSTSDPETVTVGLRGHPLPGLGLTTTDARTDIGEQAFRLLRDLRPGSVRIDVDTTSDQLGNQVEAGLYQAGMVGVPIELSITTDPEGHGIDAVIARCARERVVIGRVLIFERGTRITTRAAAVRARHELRAHGYAATVAGGSAAWFDLVNMNTIPIDAIDALAFGMCPQAHASDDATVMDNVKTLDDQVATGLRRAEGRPLVIGPVGIAYPFDPWAVGTPSGQVTGLPYEHDRRHPTLYGAAWVLGSLAHAMRPGVASITLRELAGWSGVVSARQPWLPRLEGHGGSTLGDEAVLPVYHVLADILESGSRARRLKSDAPAGTACIALAEGRRRRVLVANLRPSPRDVRLVMALETDAVEVRMLDERTVREAMHEPAAFRARTGTTSGDRGNTMLRLPPYGIARVDAVIS